jgi:toxin secretion/phage lysis holin
MKNMICTSIGVAGSIVASFFGGWTASLTTLLIFMAIDYVSGLIVAGVFHNSPKTETGTLESRAGLKGLIRKFYMLLFVLIGHRLDVAVGTTYIRDAVCIAFMANELLSIVENAGLMGLPIPAVITNSIDILKKKTSET